MKRPFLLIKTKKDIAKILFAAFLSAMALSLFFGNDEALPVFGGGVNYNRSLYGFLGSLV